MGLHFQGTRYPFCVTRREAAQSGVSRSSAGQGPPLGSAPECSPRRAVTRGIGGESITPAVCSRGGTPLTGSAPTCRSGPVDQRESTAPPGSFRPVRPRPLRHPSGTLAGGCQPGPPHRLSVRILPSRPSQSLESAQLETKLSAHRRGHRSVDARAPPGSCSSSEIRAAVSPLQAAASQEITGSPPSVETPRAKLSDAGSGSTGRCSLRRSWFEMRVRFEAVARFDACVVRVARGSVRVWFESLAVRCGLSRCAVRWACMVRDARGSMGM